MLGPAWIIQGEDPASYERLLEGVAAAIGPQDIIDWLMIKDVVALSWEIQRARRVSGSLVAMYRREAMATILNQLTPTDSMAVFGTPNADLATHWADGQTSAVAKVDALLKKAGFTLTEVDAQVLTEHADEFDRIDARAAQCEERRDKLLQQIERRRAGAAKAVLDASQGVIEAEFVATPPDGRRANGGSES